MEEEIIPEKIAELLGGAQTVAWEELPDLGLYMDQVTGFLNRLLRPFTLGRDDAPLTPSMINNYVKSGHISRPAKKKYSREQLAALYMLCSLKKNLSITDAAALIYFLSAQDGSRGAYERFVACQNGTMAEVNGGLAAEALISSLILRDDSRTARKGAEESTTEEDSVGE